MKTGIELIAIEREEQLTKHGRTVEKDLIENKGGVLADGASVLASPHIGTVKKRMSLMPVSWDDEICLRMCKKPTLERLIIAGALIAAEIDRIILRGE